MRAATAMLFPSLPLTLAAANATAGQSLNVTAIAAHNGRSVLECWSLSTPPEMSRGATNYQLGDFSGGFVGILPPRTHIGAAWAPFVQYSILLSGTVHIGLPDSTDEAWIQGGKYGIMIAADTKNVSATGHVTEFPSGDETVIVQLPLPGNKVPEHTVLHGGACGFGDLIGL